MSRVWKLSLSNNYWFESMKKFEWMIAEARNSRLCIFSLKLILESTFEYWIYLQAIIGRCVVTRNEPTILVIRNDYS